MEFGLSEQEFLHMDFGEVRRYRKAQMTIIKNRAKETAYDNYNLATLIRVAVATALNGGDFPTLADAFPNLFPELKKKQDELEAQRTAINFIDYCNSWNTHLKEETSV